MSSTYSAALLNVKGEHRNSLEAPLDYPNIQIRSVFDDNVGNGNVSAYLDDHRVANRERHRRETQNLT